MWCQLPGKTDGTVSESLKNVLKDTEICRKTLTNPSRKVIYRCIGCLNLAKIFSRRI